MLNGEYYAIKEIPKYKLYTISKIYSHLTEPNILKKLIQYDFVPKLISSFQDYEYIYLITTYYDGKYRDIMMQNIIMDKKKYFNVIDFSFSINYSEKNNRSKYLNTYNMVTPPEMEKLKEYDYNSDYYRLGSILFYLIFKTYPYIVKLKNNVTEIIINYKDVKNYSPNCIDFLNKLIISEPKQRIGFNDINELKNHSWFEDFDWNIFEKKLIESPFNLIENEFDQSLCIKVDIISDEYLMRYKSNIKKILYKALIKKFDYVNNMVLNDIINVYRNSN